MFQGSANKKQSKKKYQINANLLKSKMALAGDNVIDVAHLIGVSYQTVHSYLCGSTQMPLMHIKKIAKRYKLSPEEIVEIFLPDEC